MINETKLLPCPFCGGEAKKISMRRVGRKGCGVRTVDRGSVYPSVKAWNRRSDTSGATTRSPGVAETLETIKQSIHLIRHREKAEGVNAYTAESVVEVLDIIKKLLETKREMDGGFIV